jgi:hypothetical protein
MPARPSCSLAEDRATLGDTVTRRVGRYHILVYTPEEVWSAKCLNRSIVTRAHAPRQVNQLNETAMEHIAVRSIGKGLAV